MPQDLYNKSIVLSSFVVGQSENGPMDSTALAAALAVSVNDIPLLLAIASSRSHFHSRCRDHRRRHAQHARACGAGLLGLLFRVTSHRMATPAAACVAACGCR